MAGLTSLLWPLLVSMPLLAAGLAGSRIGWRAAQWACAACVALALLGWLALMFWPNSTTALLAMHPLNATLLLLISFIGWVVVRYAERNLAGDPGAGRFLRWLLLTLFAVMLTVASNHLLLFWCGWVGISLGLHQLLMYYPDRPRAALAAHKKYIFARIAECLLAVAFLLLYHIHGTASISDILRQYPMADLVWQQQTAATLFALVALIKCAQLPLHGWLMQVVEAPTPVSALLHAGIINLGGFLLLLFAPLFGQVLLAKWLVLVIAGLTTVVAALVMCTRISEKVRLAWSTSAQMGLMLVECALGLYELALLHLLAHSCYKAHGFLTAGSTVKRHLQQQLVPSLPPSARTWALAATVAALLVTAAAAGSGSYQPYSQWLLVGIAVAMVVAGHASVSKVRAIAAGAGLLAAYLALKSVSGWLLPELPSQYHWPADVWVASLVFILAAANSVLGHTPAKAFSHRWFVALNAGFYLDEWATRLTLQLWPVRLPRTTRKSMPNTQKVPL